MLSFIFVMSIIVFMLLNNRTQFSVMEELVEAFTRIFLLALLPVFAISYVFKQLNKAQTQNHINSQRRRVSDIEAYESKVERTPVFDDEPKNKS